MASINFGGLASGLDTQALIRAILDFERRPVERAESRRAQFSQQKSEMNELTAKLDAFESAVRELSLASSFRGRIATSSDESVLRVTPGAGAEVGLFQVEITELAAASKVKSNGFAEPDQALLTDGTITVQSGSGDPIVVQVSAAAGNNTLQQVRDAINAADRGVQAAILFDGNEYRLTVRSEETGTAHALSISDTTNSGLALAGNIVTTAADAELTVDGVEITSSTNHVTGVIPGVTLDLIARTEGTPTTIEVSQDDERVVENVQSLVSSYNDVLSYLNRQFDRDKPGVLATDPTARSVHQRLLTLFTGGVAGIPFGGIRSLSSIGVTFDGRTGEASLDESELRELLETDFDSVGDLFTSAGRATDPRIQFRAASSTTVAGTYAVQITQAAEKARVSGGGPITTLAQAETLTISDGTDSIDIALDAGLDAQQVVQQLNAALAASDVDVSASAVGGVLTLSSGSYGSIASVSVISDTGGSGGTGFSTTAATDSGLDVAGSIGGVAASGSGQVLRAADGQAFSGLELLVTATADVVTGLGGDFGSLSFSRGLIANALAGLDALTRSGDGALDQAQDLLDSRIQQLNDDIERFQERLTLRETQLLKAFAAAEEAIQTLQAQQGAFNAV